MDRRQYLGLVGITSLAGCAKVAKLIGPASRAADDAINTSNKTDTPTEDSEVVKGVDDVVTNDGLDNIQEQIPIYNIDSKETVNTYGHLRWSLDVKSEVDRSRETVTLDYQVTVRNGPAIDVYLMEQSEFQHYSNGENFLYEERYSVENTKFAEASGLIDVKNYVLLLDHTSAGVAVPNIRDSQDAEVTVELTIE